MTFPFTARTGRFAATAAIAALAIGGLAACSSQPSSSATDGGKIDGKITVWSWTAPAKGLTAAVAGFEKAHPGAKVTVIDQGNPAIWTKITTGMTAGGAGLPDVMNIGIDYMGQYEEKFPGSLADLKTYGLGKLESDFAAGPWASGQGKNGEVYGIPYEVNATGFFYRKDLWDKAGVDVSTIKSYDDLLAAGKTIKAATGAPLFTMDKAATVADSAGLFQLLMNLQNSFYFNGNGEITMNNAAGVKALEWIKKANDAGIIDDVPGGWDNFVKTEKGDIPVAAFTGGGWMAGEIQADAPDMKGKWAVAAPIAFQPGGLTAAINGGTYLTVNNKSTNKATAAAFIEYALGSMEGQQSTYKGGGMFPGYKPFLASEEFNAGMDYYGGAKVNQIFTAQLVQKTPVINYTSDYAKALKVYDDAQTQVLLKGADPKAALDAAAQQLAVQTGRKIAGS
ncbi:ABC transporter substrate-binding protein [Microbacterium sp. ASV49]|uniref:Extracellular solute-binding protein n=1 Tax=Microbacterium candidum TaxID=3041922 RepID=A0ABT7N0I2_9MICO|nr:extracellular solute-binding protein [Microbacterium sp. ASV49]MDL9980212.1 extracellular solute-binding protein [Microbacterium sp. ASV49]